jgi:hypothetical protein
MELALKSFVVPTTWLGRRIPRLLSAVNKLNHRKYGRLRRGSIQLISFDATPRDEETTEVRLVTRLSPQCLIVPVAGSSVVRKMRVYDYGDIGKVIKELTVAASRVNKC